MNAKAARKCFPCPKYQTPPSIQTGLPCGKCKSRSASTPPISSVGSDFDPADINVEDQSNVDGRNSIPNSPDAIIISDSSDAENVDDGYGSDDLMSEMDGEELKESLELQMQGEIEVLEQSQDAK
jgi:hypothetical protein